MTLNCPEISSSARSFASKILPFPRSGRAVPDMTIIRMTTASRPQQRYDHRLRDLVQRAGDLTIATQLGVPRSTARGWLRVTQTIVVSVEVADLTEQELRHEILKLRRRVEKLAALLRLALALLHTSGFTLSGERLPDGDCAYRELDPASWKNELELWARSARAREQHRRQTVRSATAQ